jgi:putative sterol carrier protein
VTSSYPFLSDQWVAEARRIRDELAHSGPAVPHQVRMNLVVTEVPFGDEPVQAHLDTSSGLVELDLGHLEEADLTVTVDYQTAKAILVDGNPQAAMQAFMAGKVRVDGDMSKLVLLQTIPPDPAAAELAQRIRAITA